MRKKTFLGKTKEIQVSLSDRHAELFALLPYKVETVESIQRGRPLRGKIVNYDFTVNVSQGRPGLHVFHVEIYDPDGTLRPEYTRNVLAIRGRGSTAIFTALNAKQGEWKVVVTDVASGITKEARFTLKKE